MDQVVLVQPTKELACMSIDEGHRRVLDYIEQTVANVVRHLQVHSSGRPTITIRRITSWKPYGDGHQEENKQGIQDREITYSFPGKNQDETWRFTCLLRILDEIQQAIYDGVVVTKRDIFYRDPTLFQRQSIVDSYIDDIACTCQVARKDLNVVAGSKGLAIGLSIQSPIHESQVIPLLPMNEVPQDLNHITWVLVVEKEAVFQTLAEHKFHSDSKLGFGLVVTAKGYPDLITSQFLSHIRAQKGYVCPFFGLFDCDPYGIDILRCYREGSKVTALEQGVALCDLFWLGVRIEDIVECSLGDVSTAKLTQNDRKKAYNMLSAWRAKSSVSSTVMSSNESCLELQRMLLLNVKAEIQALDGCSSLCRWIESRMRAKLEE